MNKVFVSFSTSLTKKFRHEEALMLVWLGEHCKDFKFINDGVWLNEEDAVAFKLKFGL
jgi:hypothetical protein